MSMLEFLHDRSLWIRSLHLRKRRNPALKRFLRSHLRPGEIAIDIGFELADSDDLLVRAVGPSGVVYSLVTYNQLASRTPWFAGQAGGIRLEQFDSREQTLDQALLPRLAGPVHLLCGTLSERTLRILSGASQLLATKSPRIVLAGSAQLGSEQLEQLFCVLNDCGYDGYFSQSHGLEDMRRFDPDRHQSDPDHPNYAAYFLYLPAATVHGCRAA
ncbi:MAG: hypothetical protein RIS70_1376 [Planctomycetota bacterium]